MRVRRGADRERMNPPATALLRLLTSLALSASVLAVPASSVAAPRAVALAHHADAAPEAPDDTQAADDAAAPAAAGTSDDQAGDQADANDDGAAGAADDSSDDAACAPAASAGSATDESGDDAGADGADDAGAADDACAADDGDAPAPEAAIGTVARGTLTAGKVKLRHAGSVDQVLTASAGAHGHRIVLGRAHRSVTKAGEVRMTMKLTKVGRARLAQAKGTLRAQLVTTTRAAGGRAHVTHSSITLRGH